MAVTIRPLTGTSYETIFEAFSKAFAQYERSWTKEEFLNMLQRRGYTPELSFGAFEGELLVSFVLNACGFYNGLSTVYDTGTGTIPEYAGHGLATRLLDHAMPVLREKGVEQYLLEVLSHNQAALSVYRKNGFRAVRQIDYFVGRVDTLAVFTGVLPPVYTVKEAGLTEVYSLRHEWEMVPSWQNSMESLERGISQLQIMAVYEGKEPVAFGIMEPATGDLAHLLVAFAHRRKKIGSFLLHRLTRSGRSQTVKCVNVDPNCKSLQAFLEQRGIGKKGTQLEMMRPL